MAFIQKREIYWMLIVGVIVMIFNLLSFRFGYPWLFWFFGGAAMGLAIQFCYAEKSKRKASRMISASISTGLITSCISLLIDYINF